MIETSSGFRRKSSAILENFQSENHSGTFVWHSEQFEKIFGNLRKVVGNLLKIVKNAVIGMSV